MPTSPSYSPLPTATRLLAILHLCWVLSFLCWTCGAPFLQHHLDFKRQVSLYKTVMGHEDLLQGLAVEEQEETLRKLRGHQERFAHLDDSTQHSIQQGYSSLLDRPQMAWSETGRSVLHHLAYGLPPFLQAYLLLSLCTVFLLLFQIEGAASTSWVLCLLLFVYTINNQAEGQSDTLSPSAQLYPQEDLLVKRYYPQGLDSSIGQQFTQLRDAWDSYLIEDWARQTPSTIEAERLVQVDQGEFFFNIAQIDALEHSTPLSSVRRVQQTKGNLLLQCLALLWTLFFSFFLNQRHAFKLVRG